LFVQSPSIAIDRVNRRRSAFLVRVVAAVAAAVAAVAAAAVVVSRLVFVVVSVQVL
jgi:hypothetical protein